MGPHLPYSFELLPLSSCRPMAQPLAHPSERVDPSTLPTGCMWRHILVADVSKITDIFEDGDQDLTAHTRVQYADLGVRADVILHEGEVASGVPMGLLLPDKGLLVSFVTKALSDEQKSAVQALGSSAAALYILPWAEALAELIAHIEIDVAADRPGRRVAVAHELRTAAVKTWVRGTWTTRQANSSCSRWATTQQIGRSRRERNTSSSCTTHKQQSPMPERVKHPVRRAIVGARNASQAVCRWVRSHQGPEQQAQTTEHRLQGNIQVDRVTRRAAARSKAGERSPLPLRIENAWVVQGEHTWSPNQLRWPIQVTAKYRPPMDWGPHLSGPLKTHPEQALIAVPLHLELWHPPTQSCRLCAHDRADLRYRGPCHRPR